MAKKKKKRGRPKLPKGESKIVLLSVRLKAADRKALDAAAERATLGLSEWVRMALIRSANQITMEKAEVESVGVEPRN